jgi:hypothetical protein
MLIEQVIAITVMFGVLVALLGALGAGVAGVTTGRQKTIATSLAKQVIETLQGSYYQDVGMNLGAAGLATDSLVTGTALNLAFEGEPLVGAATPVYPSYTWPTVDLGTTYTVRAFVTSVTPTDAAPYRRVTVLVDWTPAQRAATQRIRYSSLVYPLDYTSYPASSGSADVVGGAFTLTGDLAGVLVDDIRLQLPSVRSVANSSTLRTSNASAAGPQAEVDLSAGPLTTTSCAVSGATSDAASCDPAVVTAVSDNDVGTTVQPWTRTTASPSAASVTAPGNLLAVSVPGADLIGASTVDACTGCLTPNLGDDDHLPYSSATAATAGPLTTTLAALGLVGMEAVRVSSGWSGSGTIDQDADTGGGRMIATAQLSAPSVTLFSLPGVLGFLGAARVGAFTATATAQAGNGTSAPSTTGGPIVVELLDSTALGGYRNVPVTPGTAVDVTTSGSLVAGLLPVAISTHLVSGAGATTTAGSAPRTAATAQHGNLLRIEVDVTIGSPATVHLSMAFDYGTVTAGSTWAAG